jgi:hypothetical protein
MVTSPQQQGHNGSVRSPPVNDRSPLPGRTRNRQGHPITAQRRRSRLLCVCCAMLLLLLGILLRWPDRGGSRYDPAVVLGSHSALPADRNSAAGQGTQHLMRHSQQGIATAAVAASQISHSQAAEHGSQQHAASGQQQVASVIRAISPRRSDNAVQTQGDLQGDSSTTQDSTSNVASSGIQHSSDADDPHATELSACMRPADAQPPAPFSIGDFLAARPARHVTHCVLPFDVVVM